MNHVSSIFTRKALIAYVTVGYPSIQATIDVVKALADWGCDLIELGIPFSDPLADGATIQDASYQALKQGVTPNLCLTIAAQLRQQIDIPIVFMSYYNPILNFGLESFSKASVEAGINGFIIPDLPPEEGNELCEITQANGLDLIYFLAPSSTEDRIDFVAKQSRGFIYLVSLTGVTGARNTLSTGLESFVARVRTKTSLPLCVGFGISTPQQAHRVAEVADGVIVGSRIIQLLHEDPTMKKLESFVKNMREALN